MLRYPKKPIELADDLESFVYVLVHCALRFHFHDLHTPLAWKPGEPKTVLAQHNEHIGQRLSGFVEKFFYEEYPGIVSTVTVGGDAKFAAVDVAKPGFKLKSGAGPSAHTPLDRLIRALYALLHEHYAAIDVATFRQYEVDPDAITDHVSNLEDDGETVAPDDEVERLVEWPPSKTQRPKLVLNDHSHMTAAFSSIITNTTEAEFRRYAADKTSDQLYGSMQMVMKRPTGTSSIHVSGATSGSSKRKGSDDSELPRTKHAKLDSHPAEQFNTVEEVDEELADAGGTQ